MPYKYKFFDGKTATKYDLDIVISADKLVGKISAEETFWEWNIHDLRVIDAPQNGRDATITNRLNMAERLYVDADFFENLKPLLGKNARPVTGLGDSFKSFCLLFLVAVLAMFIIFQVALKSMSYIARHLPHKWEETLGDYAFNMYFKDKKKCVSEEGKLSLEKLLAALSHPEEIAFETLVLEDETVNAFAIPGGRIVIYSGLLEKAESAAEVAGVVAHEIGHVIKKHPTESVVRNLGLGLAVQVLFGGLDGVSDFGTIGQTLLELGYARDAERAADRIALEILDASRIDKSKFIAFFERLEEEEPDISSDIFSYFSTHPKTSERIATISAYGGAEKNYKSIMSDDEWVALKNICND